MKRNSLIVLLSISILALILLGLAFIFGCGQGAVITPPTPTAWITGRSPSLDGSWNTGLGILTITFGKSMNTSLNSFITGEGHTAGDIMAILSTPFWTKTQDGKDQLNVSIAGAISTGEVVIVSDTNGFQTSDGSQFMDGDTVLWNFNYAFDPSISFKIEGQIDYPSPTGTVTGTLYAFAYDHPPTEGDMSGIVGITIEASPSFPVNYTLVGLGTGEYYVASYMDNWLDGQYTAGEPWGAHGGATPTKIDVGPNQSGKNADLQAYAFAIENQSPALDASGIPATNLPASLTFNNAINPNSLTMDAFAYDPTHTAGIPLITSSPEISTDMRTFSLLVESWIGGTGNNVNMVATSAAQLEDINGSKIAPGTTFWRCSLEVNSVSGTITGGTSETTAIFLFTDLGDLTSPDAYGIAYLSDGSADYGVVGFADGTYYVTAWSPRSGDLDAGIQPNDIMGLYQPGNPQSFSFGSGNRTQTNIDFPLACWVGLGDPITAPYISGQITSASNESYQISVGISTDEAFFNFASPISPIALYNLSSPDGSSYPRDYYFSGLFPAITYYIVALQKIPGNTNPWPESGDYVGTAEASVIATPITGKDIYLQQLP